MFVFGHGAFVPLAFGFVFARVRVSQARRVPRRRERRVRRRLESRAMQAVAPQNYVPLGVWRSFRRQVHHRPTLVVRPARALADASLRLGGPSREPAGAEHVQVPAGAGGVSGRERKRWASSETAPAGPREEGSRFETHHAASESMFPLGTRERVPAGGMPPRGLGDRRDGALLARTEECARAGLVPPDGKRSHIIYETERARRFVGTDRRSSSRPSSPATRHGTAFLSQERRVSTRRP